MLLTCADVVKKAVGDRTNLTDSADSRRNPIPKALSVRS